MVDKKKDEIKQEDKQSDVKLEAEKVQEIPKHAFFRG